jgi:uncharacterized protein YndB with AHSA1/START domain
MILKLLALLAFVVVAILIFAATRPATFHIQRSLTIQSSPEKIFPLLNNLHNWPEWAPQDKEDSTIKRTFSGADSGVGAVSDWSGSGNTGKGRMTITESIPSKSVTIQVDWAKPFATRNMNQFVLEPDGTSTRVTWNMTGPNLFIMKLMSVFMNMDRMMGEHFETGLANLKAAAER